MTERKTKERLRQTIQGWLQRKRNGKGGRQAGSPKGSGMGIKQHVSSRNDPLLSKGSRYTSYENIPNNWYITLNEKKYGLHINLMADINYTIVVSQQSYKGVMLLLRKLDDLILKIQKKYGLQFDWKKT